MNQNPPPELITAIRLIHSYTRGHMNLWCLTGRDNAAARAKIMATLFGINKVPKSVSGITVLAEELYHRADITGTCRANQDDNWVIYSRGVLGNDRLMNHK